MKRVNAFLIILIASITALIASTAIGFVIFTQNTTNPQANWMSQMWGGTGSSQNYGGMGGGSMMGQTATTTQAVSTNAFLPYFGVVFAVLIAVTIIGIVGIAYYLVYPQMRMGAAPQPIASAAVASVQPTQTSTQTNPYESVAKTLTTEERKIIEVLNSHNGKYLQKYIRSETGLSRLQTHRIIARLADRGIVSLEKTGNTNQVYLANWLNQKP